MNDNTNNDEKTYKKIIDKLKSQVDEEEDNELIVNRLIKTIDNNIENSNKEIISKLDDFYEYISTNDEGFDKKKFITSLNDIFKLEKQNDKNLKNVEEQLKLIDNSNIDMEDIEEIIEYNKN